MPGSKEFQETITEDNFSVVRAYIDWSLKSGKMRFSQWPTENFEKIPEKLDVEGRAVAALTTWIERHLLLKTRRKMYTNIREAQFEAAKGSVQINVSEETRNLLKEYRNRLYGNGKGSMEVTIRGLLEGVERHVPEDAFRLLAAYQKRNKLPTLGHAVQCLIDQVEKQANPSRSHPRHDVSARYRIEMEQLLGDLKTGPGS